MLATLLLAASLAQAAPPSLRFKKLGPLDNDEPSMLSLLQDRQGFVWIGTYSNGLYRYDGYQAVKYAHRRNDPRSLPHDRVAAIFQDKRGRLWAGTSNGLARYNPDSNDFTVFAPPAGPANRLIVKNIISDGKDGMWVGTWGGLQHFDPDSGKFTVYVHDPARPDSLGSNDLNALALDAAGGLWVATWPGGVDHLPAGASAFRHYRLDSDERPDSRGNIVRAMQFDRDGTLWLGTEAGVASWDSRQPWAPRRHPSSPASRITSFFIDGSNTLWATTLSAGLLRWNPDQRSFEQYQHQSDDPYSLPGNNLRAMLQDRGGMLWVASFTDGIALANLSSSGFRRHVPYRLDRQGLPGTNALLALTAAPDGQVWLAANLGLSLYDPASGAVLKSYRSEGGKEGSLSHDIVYSLYQDVARDGKGKSGPLWAGTANGLNRLDADGRFKVIRFGNTASDYINAIAPGKGGLLWLATGNSLIRYDIARGSHHIYYNDPADAATRSVNGTSTVLEDRAGRVWAGSEWNGGGLDLLDPASGKFRHLRHAPDSAASAGNPGLSDDNVSSLYEDAQGRLWVGTAKGLDLVTVDAANNLHVQPYAAAVGSGKVLSIQGDRDGRIWASTIAGLYRLDPATGNVDRYSPADGLTDGYTTNSSAAGSDGTLYFGGVHGMTAVSPRAVRSDTVAPQVAVTDITVFNRSLGEGQHSEGAELEGAVTAPRVLTLSAQASVFSIEFAALHYTDPGQNRYAYQLAGFDREWVLTDAGHRNASYTNLNPGTYTFRVRAANHRGVWNAEPATLTIVITPPFWQRWWFRTALGMLVLGGLLATHRWRIRRLTRRQAELAGLVTARTAELEESNRKLAALSTTDGLTGVSNRRGFDAALAAEWRRAARTGQTVALSLLDVDHFKKYNDRYGHLAGDTCLRTVAELITIHGRRTSDIAARYGGEEFALLAAATNAADAFGVAREICAELAKLAIPHEDSPFGIVTISIGVAVLTPDEDNTAEMLVQLADQAMYRAKDKGRNQALLAIDGE
ncbi:diguanylate cyclase [Pseudoduganella sp. LjRoot289]|uniref:ligand-binding sensor domain-containing diguanylate cyclase n=1 Tax=Pseudoduganella sp. LjRoot289 TaxID=3342314 RepID=UPI003ECEDF6F